jgi:hypothetical protein
VNNGLSILITFLISGELTAQSEQTLRRQNDAYQDRFVRAIRRRLLGPILMAIYPLRHEDEALVVSHSEKFKTYTGAKSEA